VTPLALPDEPRWVEAHGMAADPASWRRELGGGFVVGSDRAKLIVAAGEVDTAGLLAIAREWPEHTLLVVTDDLAAALRGSGRPVERAILHTLPDPSTIPDDDGAASVLAPGASLAHLPQPLQDELAAAQGHVWTVFVDGLPVSFAYAPWRSARWFDISVDTVASARQLGLGTIAAAAMIRDERSHGREAVWGADEANVASLRLAKRLGFQPVDELWVSPPARP
jgi:GNAT acetyltransferase-like protein